MMLVLHSTLAAFLAVASTDPAVLDHLKKWEAATKATNTLAAEVALATTNPLTRKTSEFAGNVLYQKPNLARVRLDRRRDKPDPNDYVAYIRTGREVFEYDGLAKVVTEYRLRGGSVRLGPFTIRLKSPPFDFIDGTVTAEKLVTRLEVTRPREDDPNYVYLVLRPRSAKDRTEFDSLRLVLYGPKVAAPLTPYLPRTLVFRRSNGSEERWDLTNPVVNGTMDTRHFEFVTPPDGWKVNKVPDR